MLCEKAGKTGPTLTIAFDEFFSNPQSEATERKLYSEWTNYVGQNQDYLGILLQKYGLGLWGLLTWPT